MKKFLPLFLLVFSISAFPQTANVISENANLRGTPSTTGRVVTVLINKTKVEIIEQRGGWFLVQSPEYVGWIHGNTIQRETDPATSGYLNRTPRPNQSSYSPPTIASEASLYLPTGRCADGSFTYAATKQGACSGKGGLSSWFSDPPSTYTPRPSSPSRISAPPARSSGGTVNVRGYYRKDGTYVRPHTRRAPRRR